MKKPTASRTFSHLMYLMFFISFSGKQCMKYRADSIRSSLLLVLLFFSCSVFGIELVLNGQSIQFISQKDIIAFANSKTGTNELISLHIEELFPWMEDIQSIEVKSGTQQISLIGKELTEEKWNNSRMLFMLGVPVEVHIGEESIKFPEEISITGNILDVQNARIWANEDLPVMKNFILTASQFRRTAVSWRKTTQLQYLLTDPPDGKLPHIIFLNDLSLLQLNSEMAEYAIFREEIMLPNMKKLYLPDTSLHWLLVQNPGSIDMEGNFSVILPAVLEYFKSIRNTQSRKSLNSIMTGSSNLQNVNIKRFTYAAIPTGLSPKDEMLAQHILRDIRRNYSKTIISSNTKSFPMSPITNLYYDAYSRIGRLAISGQLSSKDAAILVSNYVRNNQK